MSKVAILGSPNVGKSTLFNILTETRDALVKNQPGVTRDVHIGQVQWENHRFEIIDTGGLTQSQTDSFSSLIKNHIQKIIPSVNCLIVVVDAHTNLSPQDQEVVHFARQTNKPFLIVANKVDCIQDWQNLQSDFYSLGQTVYPAAFEKHLGVSEILDWITSHIPLNEAFQQPIQALTQPILSLIGKPNVGKSHLFNHLLGSQRMLVTDIPGTTTDSIDSLIEYKDKSYTLIDTAGLRRKSYRKQEGLEILAGYKTKQAMYKADIILLLVDVLEGLGKQEAQLVQQALEMHTPVILVINKTDLALPEFRKNIQEQINKCFHFFTDIPVVFISAETGVGLDSLFLKINTIWKKLHFRISTSHLNHFFTQVTNQQPPPLVGSTPIKFYYLTQTHQVPPSFIAFTNKSQGLTSNYKKFLIRKIKQKWSLSEIPIRIFPLKKSKV